MAELSKFVGDGGDKKVKLHDLREAIRQADEDELQEILQSVQTELFEQRTQTLMQQVSNPMRIRQLRKLVARIHTELGARRIREAA